jgi:hypothetical protein
MLLRTCMRLISYLTLVQFYAFSTDIPAFTSVSSFTVFVAWTSGKTQAYDNNGKGFPIFDGVIVQTPQSCVDNGRLRVLAAVCFYAREDI